MTSQEFYEHCKKHRDLANTWIFETCPIYTKPGAVHVQQPVWKDVPKGMSSFHRNISDVVAESLSKKAREGRQVCGGFEQWRTRKAVKDVLETRQDELQVFNETFHIRNEMKDIFRRSSFIEKPPSSGR